MYSGLMSSQDMDRFLLTLREVHSQPCSMALGTLANRSCTPFKVSDISIIYIVYILVRLLVER
jgi:hypothetical protein